MDRRHFVDLIEPNKYLFEKNPGDVIFCFDKKENKIKYRFNSIDTSELFLGKGTKYIF